MKDIDETLRRAWLTKYECLVVKALASTTKSPEAKVVSIGNHKCAFQKVTKKDADECFFKPILKECDAVKAMVSATKKAATQNKK
jgi:hypothetical protein